MVTLDAAVAAASLVAALELRFDGAVPGPCAQDLWTAVPVAVGARACASLLARVHHWAFFAAGFRDALRVALAGLAGSAALFGVAHGALSLSLPRSVYVLDFFLATTLLGAVRFGPRAAFQWACGRRRRRSGACRALVVGIGREAELLVHDLARDPDGPHEVVGLVGDDPGMVGLRLDGAEVLGAVRDLPALIRRHGVRTVLLANPREPAQRIRELLDLCATSRARFKIAPASSRHLDGQLSHALLHDLAPEDLLPRRPVAFDAAETRARVAGRRVLVTGAGGSIGGEMCRQLVRHGAGQLVMVDMNENELYLASRRLAGAGGPTDLRAEVADVRDPDRLGQLGDRYRPELVFHAAAHKHVPLMETAPEEAVKNNVFGSLNVARMADAAGSERFVLISTDKAVRPSSVMGVSKRIAEMAVRHFARSARTRVTAVRFGNVLGSAGSVVPLFKEQIERGGPVTVTHPECRRYFMTIPEAVGLVLVAGLGDHGELCVLDMGEQIRIADLAKHLITLAGHVPGDDIALVYTGLRPGEKLEEQLLTEEEEETRSVRDRILVARSPAPRGDLDAHLALLGELAAAGDRAGLLREFRLLVPSYRPAPGDAEVRAEAAAAAGPGRPAQAVSLEPSLATVSG